MEKPQDITLTTYSQSQIERMHGLHREFLKGRGGIRCTIKYGNLSGLDLSGLNFSRAQFVSCDFTGADLSRSKFIQAEAFRCWFESADLQLANFSGADLRGSEFRKTILKQADMRGADFRLGGLGDQFGWRDSCCRFIDADLSDTNLSFAKLRHANFEDAELTGTVLENADLRDASFEYAIFMQANLSAARVTDTNFRGASFQDCTVSNLDFSKSMKRAKEITDDRLAEMIAEHRLWVESNGKKGRRAMLARHDLSGRDLSGQLLAMIDFEDSVFVDTNLKNSILAASTFKGANLKRAALNGADVRSSDFRTARVAPDALESTFQGSLPNMKMQTKVDPVNDDTEKN